MAGKFASPSTKDKDRLEATCIGWDPLEGEEDEAAVGAMVLMEKAENGSSSGPESFMQRKWLECWMRRFGMVERDILEKGILMYLRMTVL